MANSCSNLFMKAKMFPGAMSYVIIKSSFLDRHLYIFSVYYHLEMLTAWKCYDCDLKELSHTLAIVTSLHYDGLKQYFKSRM